MDSLWGAGAPYRDPYWHGTAISALSPSWVCVPREVTLMPPQGQPGTLDVLQELFQVCGVAPVVEVQEGWGAPLAIPPSPRNSCAPSWGQGTCQHRACDRR